MVPRRVRGGTEDVEAVGQSGGDERHGRGMPAIVAEPVPDGASDRRKQVKPNALGWPLRFGGLVEEMGDETGKDHHGDPIINGLHP